MRVHGYAMSHLWSSRAADRLTKSLPAVLPHQRVVSTARTTSTLLLQGSMPEVAVTSGQQHSTRLLWNMKPAASTTLEVRASLVLVPGAWYQEGCQGKEHHGQHAVAQQAAAAVEIQLLTGLWVVHSHLKYRGKNSAQTLAGD